jgi:hypothetical protein
MTTQQSGQTPDKTVKINHFIVYGGRTPAAFSIGFFYVLEICHHFVPKRKKCQNRDLVPKRRIEIRDKFNFSGKY